MSLYYSGKAVYPINYFEIITDSVTLTCDCLNKTEKSRKQNSNRPINGKKEGLYVIFSLPC